MSRWWLWKVLLFLPPVLPSEESKHSSEAGQTRHLQETQDGFVNQTETLRESETDGMRVTQNSSPPSDGGWRAVTTTPFHIFVVESSTKYQANPSSPHQGASASVYTKYLVPALVVLVLLVALFFMYRRKRGSGTRSRTVSINESLDSEDEDCPKVAPTFPRQAFTPIPEETLQMTEALASSKDEEIPDSQDPHSSQT